MNMGLNPGRRAEKPVTNRPSYDAVLSRFKKRKCMAQKIAKNVFGI
jgi:hypothetical protein